ncbi:hypothetical protein LPB72_16645 [Hydrogenophaga crassostreae]|uniref:UDP-glucose 4-epimerase n=1 Tax=Hydrogenophaga crassostreae TaxID=1763535 RepID=A0A167H983_9BURK|nr:NAD-dependent epimerase/dehydratase family protein [Hydrogenophaga crassostreae]AOW12657.1 hypothetical protein LPB072_07160 [Hydrogenophaga crassostreae]OAD40528.1 hypothetical protein LPB72_16645 [Hydrogenophaga crassostreae]
MIVTVFGGSGFIGSRLIARLLDSGHTLRVFDRSFSIDRYPGVEGRLKHYPGDFSNQTDFSEIVEGSDIVFHLISTTLPSGSNNNPVADIQGNLVPTIRLLESMKQCGVSRLVFPSSGGTVYGEAQYLPIDERHPTQPIVSYGATKLAIEKYLAIYRNAFDFHPISLRISNPYGPGFRLGSSQGAVGAFLLKAMTKKPIDIWGTGEIRRDYIYIEDLIDAMEASMTFKGSEMVFNISTGIGTSLLELIDLIQKVTGEEMSVNHFHNRSFDVQTNILDRSLASSQLGWQPATSLLQGVEMTWAWLQKNSNSALEKT